MSTLIKTSEAFLRRLEWTVLRQLDGMLMGDYRTLMRGFGLDLADLREYQFQDDVRHIDWNVTARLDTPYVRIFNEERDLAVWFLLDLSPSMDYGERESGNSKTAIELVAVLARMLGSHGNRIGAILYGERPDTIIPARSGRSHLLRLLHQILSRPALPRSQGTDLAALLLSAQRMIKRRSLLFVISDFISKPGWERPLAALSLRHEVIGVRLYDPVERELPDLGLLVIQDPESGEQVYVDTHDRYFRNRFEALAAQRENGLRAALATAGVDALELANDDDLVDVIWRFSALRRQRRRLAPGASRPMRVAPRREGA